MRWAARILRGTGRAGTSASCVSNTEHTIRDDERRATGGAQTPYDGDDSLDYANVTAHNRTFVDEEHRVKDDSPLSMHGDYAADKAARSQIRRARAILAVGLVLEVSATLWAFWQAVSAGALDTGAICYGDDIFDIHHVSSITEKTCDKLVDEEAFFDFTAGQSSYYSSSAKWEDYVGCDTLTDGSAVIESFLERCSCSDKVYVYEGCYWVALLRPSDGICYAQGVRASSSDGAVTFVFSNAYNPCWASNPPGSAGLTITALAVALSSQLLEAFVGFKYWKASDKRTKAFMFAASVCDALGVVVVSSVLLTLPGFYGVSDYTDQLPVLLGLAWLTVTVVVAGALAEITAEYSSRAAARFPYLGAVGNASVWLGAALLEIVVTSYVLWTGARLKNVVELAADAAVLFALELLALVAMWTARRLWTRANIFRSKVKALEGPLRKRVSSSPIG